MRLSDPIVEQGAVDIPAACAFTGLGRSFLYGKIQRGELRSIKLGKRRLIPRAELVRLLAEGLK